MAKQAKSKWNGFSLRPRKEMPAGLWTKCPACEHMLYKSAVEKNLNVCPECNHHFRISASTRIKYLTDEDSFQQVLDDLKTSDPLSFKFRDTTYKQRIKADQKKSGAKEAMLVGKAFIKGRPLILAVMEPNFLMGSMGAVVGEKLCAAVDMAMDEKLPLVVFSCSGGARMHEGVVSLGQMAKTSAAVAKFDEAGGLFISVLTDPTTGGVTASFAMLGDCIIAEPGALIGFAGPRTIAETIKVELPEGFQTAEFMLEHGFVDMIVDRKDLRREIARLIDYCQK
ncbi:MAG: acetyl-CoA carboxylase carboxyltransferase subunit beta [Phycisphaerae bacterium]|nr:acetyl-CoA carboxylase carboxyltransferase subunit beta [Phycisphaerae bacterium]NIS53598.1 acetyl-CoA carboxylase carboxyltransferase subunit beta [Phycisphaerae bacterium]NIU08211.1 acetyl-CoA carboxylase carboxyltransferase subunit beta [Phycisphaerae bacterium]NIU55722.1 acetyl-CoA carboxylase carboxyltransferase subunit beta [Phycisphaerae bacterium]NIW92193.1 acetyl-CoA carboxylase carboxyltransferase subunit beta [Phycisphaerae bacterium]